jgi:hypothetical protein
MKQTDENKEENEPQRESSMWVVFRLEHIGSTDFAATTHLGANLGQMGFLFVFRDRQTDRTVTE